VHQCRRPSRAPSQGALPDAMGMYEGLSPRATLRHSLLLRRAQRAVNAVRQAGPLAPQLELLVPGRIRPGPDGRNAYVKHIRLAAGGGFDAALEGAFEFVG
jgi:hypothetical protein